MLVGILKEIKVLEKRVCMTPTGVITLKQNGHDVLVEKKAGTGAGFPDAEYVAAGLKGHMVQTAVNIAPVAPEVYEKVGPYIELAENLGKLMAQTARGGVDGIEIQFVGGLADVDTRILKTAVLKGLLTVVSAESINFVNADYYAEQRGISVTETKRSETSDYVSLLGVKATTPHGDISVGATLVGKRDEPRLVSLYQHDIDMTPSQHMAFFVYDDKPGMIGKVGTILGAHDINIGSMEVGRTTVGGEALMGINIDTPVSRELLDKIVSEVGINDAWSVEL